MKENENQIVVYQPDEVMRLEVRLENETVWLTQAQLCELFQRDVSVISRHIKNIFSEGELEKESNLHFCKFQSWVDVGTLDMLAKKRKGVAVEVVASKRGNKLAVTDVAKFNAEYGSLTLKESAAFHDRFLILDDKELYLIGASLKDLGKKCFGFTRKDAGEIPGIKARVC